MELTSPSGDFFLDLHEANEELLKEWCEGRPAQIGPAYFNHIAFEVEDMDKACEELRAREYDLAKHAVHAPRYRSQARRRCRCGRSYWIQLTEIGK